MGQLRVVASNCGCCAIKHIRDFPIHVDDNVYLEPDGHDDDQSSSMPNPYDNWLFADADIEEKVMEAGVAFRYIVAQIKKRRPAGLITLNLVSSETSSFSWCCEECSGMTFSEYQLQRGNDFDRSQVTSWDPLLKELGFSRLDLMNSNSGNLIHHYTLAYNEGF